MIQLKPGLQPSLSPKPQITFPTPQNRPAKRSAACVLSGFLATPTVAPFDQIEWERRTAEITDDSGKVIFKQEEHRGAEDLERARDEDRRLEIFLRRHRQRHRPAQGRPRNARCGNSIHRVTRTITDWGIADGYFADAESAGDFLRRTDLALRESARRVQFAGLVQRRPVSPVRHRQGRAARATISTIARPARPSAPRRSTNTRRAAPASSNRVDDTMEDIMRLAMSEAMLFKYGSGTGTDLSSLCAAPARNSAAAASRAARSRSSRSTIRSRTW